MPTCPPHAGPCHPEWVRAGSTTFGHGTALQSESPCPAPLPAPSICEGDGMDSEARIHPHAADHFSQPSLSSLQLSPTAVLPQSSLSPAEKPRVCSAGGAARPVPFLPALRRAAPAGQEMGLAARLAPPPADGPGAREPGCVFEGGVLDVRGRTCANGDAGSRGCCTCAWGAVCVEGVRGGCVCACLGVVRGM